MTTERRYGDEEVREIFNLATTGDPRDQSLPADSGGLTLDEIQRIGQQAGIEPARVEQAAKQLDARGRPSTVQRSFFGLPVGVSRMVDLPRAPTDREWEQLVAECRSTFGVQGKATTSGGLREWSYGNLHVSVEPTERGERLRLGTRNDEVVAFNLVGSMLGGMSLFLGAITAAAGKPHKAAVIFGVFATMSLIAFTANLIRTPRWAHERERQMEELAEYAVTLLSKA